MKPKYSNVGSQKRSCPKSEYDYWRTKAELGSTKQERWKEVKRLAEGREDELHYRVTEHIKRRYPDAIVIAGIGEHLTTDHARMDAYLKGYTGGQPDILVIRGLPNCFQDVLAIELKNPNKKGKVQSNQVEYLDNLELNCRTKIVLSSDYDDVVLQIHDHYKDVFARAQIPAITDKQPEYDFSTNNKPKYWCNKLKNKTNLMIECKKRGYEDMTYQLMTNCEIAKVLIEHDSGKDKLVIEM